MQGINEDNIDVVFLLAVTGNTVRVHSPRHTALLDAFFMIFPNDSEHSRVFIFSQGFSWGFHSSGTWHRRVIASLVPDVAGLSNPETSGPNYPVTRRRIPEERLAPFQTNPRNNTKIFVQMMSSLSSIIRRFFSTVFNLDAESVVK